MPELALGQMAPLLRATHLLLPGLIDPCSSLMMSPSIPPVRVPQDSGQGQWRERYAGSLQRSGPCSSGRLSRCWQRALKHLKSLHQMFSCTSLPRSAKGAWFNCGYLQPKESGWQFAGSQGFYFSLLFSISEIYGPWVWQNWPEKL